MLRHFLTDDVFQSGIVRYLRKYSYKNAQNQDLWDSLANVWTQITLSVLHTVWSFDIILTKEIKRHLNLKKLSKVFSYNYRNGWELSVLNYSELKQKSFYIFLVFCLAPLKIRPRMTRQVYFIPLLDFWFMFLLLPGSCCFPFLS